VATDGTLNHIVLGDGDELPEHWVFGSNSTTSPAAPMGVNANASEAAPDFDITMATPGFATFATFGTFGSPGADVIDGSGGGGQSPPHLRPITISGRDGADVLKGASADDAIDGGAGDAAADGGPGFDIADYFDSVLPVSIDLAATGLQDGDSMGRDTLASIEYLGGGEAGDHLRGTAAKETLGGGPGDDVLEAAGVTTTCSGPRQRHGVVRERRRTGDGRSGADHAAGDRPRRDGHPRAGGERRRRPGHRRAARVRGPEHHRGGAGRDAMPAQGGTAPCSRATGDRTP
jgi:Ca2+-binding RTX toxin-like protein